jgi:flagellar assembly protein FliH
LSPSNDILIRGDQAAHAQPIDLANPQPITQPAPHRDAVGPWAEEINKLYENAKRQGYEQGVAEGREIGIEQGRMQMANLSNSLAETASRLFAEIEARSAEVGQQVAAKTTQLALEIATAVLNREIATSEDPGAEALARCIDLAPNTGDMFARLNPSDAAELRQVEGLGDRGLMITADPTLGRGDAIVTINDVTIDARISESLRRVAEALR